MTENNNVQLSSFYGQKSGMTRIFDSEGNSIPVTVIKLIPNKIVQIKSVEKEGYNAYQVGFYEKRPALVTKPIAGHLKKSGIVENFVKFYELKTETPDVSNLGKSLGYENFQSNTYVDVTSISKGKGFQGVVKKYGFAGGPASHGSHFHRRTGSIGNRATPGRVFAGKKMPGQMGSEKVTTQNLKIVEINLENGFMLIKGSVPGHKNSFIKISSAKKKS